MLFEVFSVHGLPHARPRGLRVYLPPPAPALSWRKRNRKDRERPGKTGKYSVFFYIFAYIPYSMRYDDCRNDHNLLTGVYEMRGLQRVLWMVAGLLLLISPTLAEAAATAAANGKSSDAMGATMAELPYISGATSDGWIYYTEYDEDSETSTLMKKKADGSGVQAVKESEVLIQPYNYSRAADYRYADYNVIPAANKPAFLKQLAQNPNAFIIDIIGDSVLYWVGTVKSGRFASGTIKKAKLDGKQVTAVAADNGKIDFASFTIYKNTLFYTMEEGETNSLYRVGLDGKNKKKLAGDYYRTVQQLNKTVGPVPFYSPYQRANIAVSNDQIVYVNMDKALVRLKIDGSGKLLLNKSESGNSFVDGDWLYYTTKANPDAKDWLSSNFYGPIYKVKLTGGKPIPITKGHSSLLFVKDGWVYYETESYELDQRLIRVRTDGSGAQNIISGLVGDQEFYVRAAYGDWLTYGIYDNEEPSGEYRIRMNGTGKTKLSYSTDAYVETAEEKAQYEQAVAQNYGKYKVPDMLKQAIALEEELRERKMLLGGGLIGPSFAELGIGYRYESTPIDVIPFAVEDWDDEVHYGFLTDFGTVRNLEEAAIVRVSPYEDDPVQIVARNFREFMQLLAYEPIGVRDLDTQTSEEDYAYLKEEAADVESSLSQKEKDVRSIVRERFALAPIGDTYAYLQKLGEEREQKIAAATEDGLGVVYSGTEAAVAKPVAFDFEEYEDGVHRADLREFFEQASTLDKLVFFRDAQSYFLWEGNSTVMDNLQEQLQAMGLEEEANRIAYPETSEYDDEYEDESLDESDDEYDSLYEYYFGS